MTSQYVAERLEGRRLLASGNVDPGFGNNGVVSGYSELLGGGSALAVAVQTDGRIIAAGGTGNVAYGSYNFDLTSHFALVRLLPNGSPDSSFGTGGIETAAPEPYCYIQSIALQADGKIIAAGAGGADNNQSHIIVGRFNADGSVDTTFASAGFVTTTVGDFDSVSGLSLQPDGKIVVLVASDTITNNTFSASTGAVLRYTADGAPDGSFGTGAKSLVFTNTDNLGATVRALAMDNAGGIFVQADDYYNLYVEKLTSAGTADPHFGTGGIAQEPFDKGFAGMVGGMAVQADGRIVVAGTGGGIMVTRFTPSGKVDKTFGRRGSMSVTLQDHTGGDPQFFAQNANATPVGLAVQRDGKIVVGGYVLQIGLDDKGEASPARFAAVRFTPAGQLDRGFGSAGTLQLGTGNLWPTLYNYPTAVAMTPDGSIVLTGNSLDNTFSTITTHGIEMVKLTPRGVLDSRFGYSGRVGPFPKAPPAQLAAITADGKTLLATAKGLARLLPDGSLDPSFGKGGMTLDSQDIVDDNVKDINQNVDYLSVQSNGDILEAIEVTTHYQTLNKPQIYTILRRFHADGSPDTQFGTKLLIVPQPRPASPGNHFEAMAVQPDGKIVLVSHADASNAEIVTRYSRSGALDRSFGTGGSTVLRPFGATGVSFSRIGFDPNSGNIVLAGIGTLASASDPDKQQNELVLYFLDSRGRIDPQLNAAFQLPRALAGTGQLLDMQVLDGGWIYVVTRDNNGLALSRYFEGGLDETFGTKGTVTPAMPAGLAASAPFFIQPDGAIVGFIGSTATPYTTYAARFTRTGALDTNYGDQGLAALPTGTATDVVARAADGTLILSTINYGDADGTGTQIVRLLG